VSYCNIGYVVIHLIAFQIGTMVIASTVSVIIADRVMKQMILNSGTFQSVFDFKAVPKA
jgi:hypothetical protein